MLNRCIICIIRMPHSAFGKCRNALSVLSIRMTSLGAIGVPRSVRENVDSWTAIGVDLARKASYHLPAPGKVYRPIPMDIRKISVYGP